MKKLLKFTKYIREPVNRSASELIFDFLGKVYFWLIIKAIKRVKIER